MDHLLHSDKLLKTVEHIHERIDQHFPNSGLSQLAIEIVQLQGKALEQAEAICRPNWWLRAGLIVLAVIAIAGTLTYELTLTDHATFVHAVLQFLDAAKGSAAILTGLAVFLITLETRLKRRRALQAVHELRAMAHLIDLYHLAKQPDRLHETDQVIVSGHALDADAMGRYLHFCIELLAVVSKIGQLYVQDFPDSAAQMAVNQFEGLASGLSSKIWQKLMILDRITADARWPQAGGPQGLPQLGPPGGS